MRFTKLLISATGLSFGLTVVASAADMPVKAPIYKAPAAVVAYNWSGCYVGANAGWIRNDSTLHVQPTGRYLDLPGAFAPALLAFVTQDYPAHGSSGTAGGQVGCNVQRERWVFGIEGDFNWTGVDDSVSAAYPQTPFFSGTAFLPRSLIVTHKLDWLSTIRGRVGYSFDRLLVFGTGGLAIGRVKSSFFQQFPGITDLGSEANTRLGWTGGGGLEYAFDRNWTAKVEYLYVDLGSFSYDAPASDDPRFLWTTTVKTRDHIVRVGINYKFGDTPLVANY
jgi:outer membrane immunogenic protein